MDIGSGLLDPTDEAGDGDRVSMARMGKLGVFQIQRWNIEVGLY